VKKIYRELNLTLDQSQRLDALEDRIDTLNRRHKSQLKQRREALDEVYRRYHLDQQRARRLQAEIRAIQGQMLELHHTFQVDLRRILTPSQFDGLQRAVRHGD
jgi:Spy/CpxP family protein refolding chaperone